MPLPPEQFEQLALAEIDAVSRLARSLSHHAAEAEDLTQETYLKAIRARDKFTLHEMGMRPWLLRILRNTWLNRLTRRELEPVVVAPESLQEAAAPSVVLVDIDWRSSDGRLVRAIQQLPESLRTTLLLWALDEMTYKDIAAVTDVPIGTVMSRLHRARHVLSERLGTLAKERGIGTQGMIE